MPGPPPMPPQAVLPSQEDKLELCFRDPVFLQRHGGGLPNAGAALDYLSLSPDFYVPSCINEQVKMQSRFSALNSASLDVSKMTGIEYYTWYSDVARQIFHLVKQYKHSATLSTPMAAFYILGGTTYQAPDLHTLLASRLRSSLTHLTLAFKQFTDFAKFDPPSGYHWDSVCPTPRANAAANAHDGGEKRRRKNKQKKVNADRELENISADYAAQLHAEYQSRVDMLIFDSAQTQHVQLIEKPRAASVDRDGAPNEGLRGSGGDSDSQPQALNEDKAAPPPPPLKQTKVRSVAGSSTGASTTRRAHRKRRNKEGEHSADVASIGAESRHSKRSQKASKRPHAQKSTAQTSPSS